MQVELDRHVRELAEEMKRLLVENMQLQQGVAPTLAAGDGHARLEEEMQASQRQVVHVAEVLAMLVVPAAASSVSRAHAAATI